MTHPWEDYGCAVCRHQWEVGDAPPQIGMNIALHARLHRCEACGTLWEQTERFAAPINAEEARARFPEAQI